jgi:hypothetical protein
MLIPEEYSTSATFWRVERKHNHSCERWGIDKHKILSQSCREASYHIVDEKEVAENGNYRHPRLVAL